MRKPTRKKLHQVILKLPLPRIYYYYNKRLQVKESQYLYQPTVEPLPQYQIGLILQWQSFFVMHDSQYVTNQLRGS